MRSIKISGAEPKPLGAPPDWNPETSGHCAGLFVRRENIGGLPFMRSAWEVDAIEAAYLLAGASIGLGVQGHQHPVVNLGVLPLPDDFEPVIYSRRYTAPDGRPCLHVEMLIAADGPRRIFSNVLIGDNGLAPAMALAVEQIEQLARTRGWIT